MRFWLIVLAALGVVGPAQAANYYLTSTQKNQAMFIDLDTVSSSAPGTKRFWLANIMLADPRAAYLMVFSEVNCIDQTTKALEIAAYDESGILLTSFNPQNGASLIATDTPAEVQFKLACEVSQPVETRRFGNVEPLLLRSALTTAQKTR